MAIRLSRDRLSVRKIEWLRHVADANLAPEPESSAQSDESSLQRKQLGASLSGGDEYKTLGK
jgi:hypothetical protein